MTDAILNADERFDPESIPAWSELDNNTRRVISSALRLYRMRRFLVPTGFPKIIVGREKDLLAKSVEQLANQDDIPPITAEELDRKLA